MARQELTACCRLRAELTEAEVARMYALFEQYYEAVSAELFCGDLSDKDYVVTLRDGDELAGFSTLKVFEFVHPSDGQPIAVMFSGDTVIEQQAWGSQALPRAFAHCAGMLWQRYQRPLYWLLITKGQRTYRYLPLYVKEFWPRYENATPPEMQRLLDALALERFGRDYDAERGLLRFAQPRGHLRAQWASVRENLIEDPHVRFFLQRNPGYLRGDELVCIACFAPDNLRGAVLRAFLEGAQSRHAA